MPRRAITAADIRPFLEKTGQLHLLDGLGVSVNAPAPLAGASPSPFEGSGGPSGPQKGKKRLKMNQTEEEFSRILEAKRVRGELFLWEYEAITLRWGVLDAIKYTPDFVIFDSIEVTSGGIPVIQMRFIETKGAHIWQKDLDKFKAARNRWVNIFHFEMHQRIKGDWTQLY